MTETKRPSAERGGCGCGALLMVVLCAAVGNLWGRMGRLEALLDAAPVTSGAR